MSCFGDSEKGKDQEKKWHEILARHEGEEDLTLALLNDKEYQQLCEDIVSSFNYAKLPEYDLFKLANSHPYFEVPSEEELSLLKEAALEDLKQKEKAIFEADGKMIEERRNKTNEYKY
jgi:hypothetical protein